MSISEIDECLNDYGASLKDKKKVLLKSNVELADYIIELNNEKNNVYEIMEWLFEKLFKVDSSYLYDIIFDQDEDLTVVKSSKITIKKLEEMLKKGVDLDG